MECLIITIISNFNKLDRKNKEEVKEEAIIETKSTKLYI